jgi:hypothetical protein
MQYRLQPCVIELYLNHLEPTGLIAPELATEGVVPGSAAAVPLGEPAARSARQRMSGFGMGLHDASLV